MRFRDDITPRFLLGCFAEGAPSPHPVADPAPSPAPAPDPAPAPAWYESIQDEGVKGLASKYESQDKLLEAVGYKAPDWRETIPEQGLRDHAGRFTSITDLVKGHKDLREKLSTAIVPPGKDAKPEDVAAFHKRLGALESPEAYAAALFPAPQDGTEVPEYEQASQKQWAERFHKLGTPKSMAESLIADHREDMAKASEAVAAEDKKFADASEAENQREWGSDYARNKAFANDAAARLFGSDLDAMRQLRTNTDRFFLDDPRMVRMLAKIGREMQEGGLAPVSDDARETMQGEIRDLRQKQTDALAKGETKLANELYQKEQELLARLKANQPVVGAHGRAA